MFLTKLYYLYAVMLADEPVDLFLLPGTTSNLFSHDSSMIPNIKIQLDLYSLFYRAHHYSLFYRARF